VIEILILLAEVADEDPMKVGKKTRVLIQKCGGKGFRNDPRFAMCIKASKKLGIPGIFDGIVPGSASSVQEDDDDDGEGDFPSRKRSFEGDHEEEDKFDARGATEDDTIGSRPRAHAIFDDENMED